MADAVARQDTEAVVVITAEQIGLIQRTIAKDATPEELQLFFYDCRRQGVHPLDRMIHFTKRSGRYTPVTSIDLMRARAAETGECAGIDDPIFDVTADQVRTATVIVYRLTQGARYPYTATARWAEYYPGDVAGVMWKKMPHTMLGKCAEALALRKAFPKQLSGLYAREEMDQAGGTLGAVARGIDPATGEVVEREAAVVVEQRSDGSALVTDITTTSGGNWTKHLVTFDDGRAGATFDEKLRAQAAAAKDSGILVIPTFEQKGKYTNLIGLTPVTGAVEPEPSVAGAVLVNPAQVTRFHSIAKHHGWTEAERAELLSAKGYASSKDIPVDVYDGLIDDLKSRQPKGK